MAMFFILNVFHFSNFLSHFESAFILKCLKVLNEIMIILIILDLSIGFYPSVRK